MNNSTQTANTTINETDYTIWNAVDYVTWAATRAATLDIIMNINWNTTWAAIDQAMNDE